MSISPEDIVLLKAERFTDENDGGGQMTGTVIPQGIINNVWDDISRPLMAIGGVSMRKLFMAIRSANTDKGLGSHMIILKDAAPDNVSTLLFSTTDHYDERLSAQDKVEQYVVMGTRSGLRPVGTQRERQTALVLYSEREQDMPEIGEVLILKQGTSEQAVKVTRADSRKTTYTYIDRQNNYRTFEAYEITLRITQPLERDFEGRDPEPVALHETEIFKTQSSVSARYYGIKPLVEAANAGQREVKVTSIFSPIVPAATTEQSILDQRPGLMSKVVQPTGAVRTVGLGSHAGSVVLYLPSAWQPGSLRLTIGSSQYSDEAAVLRLLNGVNNVSASSVNPTAGTIQITLNGPQAISAQFLPGVSVELLPYTDSEEITAGNRQITYTAQLQPLPMPGSTRVEFCYLGRWYVISDDGTGSLVGPSSSGTVNYDTGSLSFVLPGEPDLGSELIYTWAQSPYAELTAGNIDAWLVVELPQAVGVGDCNLTWQRGNTAYTATANSNNVLTGHATGYVLGNRVYMRPNVMPDGPVSVSYGRLITSAQIANVAIAARTGGTFTIDIGATNIARGTVSFNLALSLPITTTIGGIVTTTRTAVTIQLRCDHLNNVVRASGGTVGSFNSATGVMTIDADLFTRVVEEFVQVNTGVIRGGGQFMTVTKTMRIESQTLAISYVGSNTMQAATYTCPLNDLTIEASLPNPMRSLLPGSLLVRLSNNDFIDRGDGYLYRSFNALTGSGVQAGQVDYSESKIVLPFNLIADITSNFTALLITGAGGIGAAAAIQKVVFRTLASPLRPSGLQFLARRVSDAALLRAESNNEGEIGGAFDTNNRLTSLPQPGFVNGYSLPIIIPDSVSGGSATGSVNYETGVVKIEFTQPVILSTLTYNAVTYTTVPLSPDVLGLNPVKLPTNGTVPVFQPGYLAVIHHTADMLLQAPTAGQEIDCGREKLAVVTIKDAAGVDLDSAMYVVDRALGTVTLADPFIAQDSDENTLTMPLTLSHRIEDVVALGSVGVDGTLQLLTDLIHSYPAGAYCSAAVHFGTLQARIKNVFDRQVDSGSFGTAGTAAVASYDTVNYPILIDNRSAVKERWKIRFSSTTGFQCIGEKRGVIATGSINADFSPINPFTGQPYFTIKKDGWGEGWVTSNTLEFETEPAAAPVWAIRTVLPKSGAAPEDKTIFEVRVEAD